MKKILIVAAAVVATVFISVLVLKRVYSSQEQTAGINNTIHKFYDVKGTASGNDYQRIESTVESLAGVTSCVVNGATRILAVSYFPGVQKEDNIIEKVKSLGGFDLSYHVFKINPNIKTCPVTGPNSLYGKFKSFIISI